MKINRNYLLIVLSSIALILVLIIQVNWIIQSANIKENIFNEKANMVLTRTSEALQTDVNTCNNIEACLDSINTNKNQLGSAEVKVLDSLFNHYMKVYNVQLNYTYVVAQSKTINSNKENKKNSFIYNKRLDPIPNIKGLELKLIFPEKKQYIIAEMGSLFITSIVLILVVLMLFWRTVVALLKEKNISEHTTDFLNNMTHEFKTPLTNIALASKMILKENNIHQVDKVKHYSGIILAENDKLRLQVEQVLSMTALERGEIPLNKTEIDMHQLISHVVARMNIQLDAQQVKLNLNLNALKTKVFADESHLSNAICNLLDNAIKYAMDIMEISIQTRNDGQYLIIEISDQGIGIEKKYQQKVFEKFFRVPKGDVHDVKGFGLGLAYIKNIIELHNGIITLNSEIGKGSTFTITLKYV